MNIQFCTLLDWLPCAIEPLDGIQPTHIIIGVARMFSGVLYEVSKVPTARRRRLGWGK